MSDARIEALSVSDRVKSLIAVAENGCWEWQGLRLAEGYGLLTRREAGSKETRAHRHIYTVLVGPIPAGLHLDHLCHNPCCVNPSHLEPVTPAENARRAVWKQSGLVRIRYCRRGHELTEDNVVRNGRSRLCRICHKAQRQRRDAEKKAEVAALRMLLAKIAPEDVLFSTVREEVTA